MKKIITLWIFLSVLFPNVVKAEEVEQKWEVVANYDNRIPSDIRVNLKYPGAHPTLYDYVFITTRTANVRETPSMNGKILAKYSYDQKIPLLSKVLYQGNYWYQVDIGHGKSGFISTSVSQQRNFRFDMALDRIHRLENFLKTERAAGRKIAATNSYAPNPNHVGLQKHKDKYGTSADQNTAGRNAAGEVIYIPDRSLISIHSSSNGQSTVKALSVPDVLTISNQYISNNNIPETNFTKVVAIDSLHQNFMIFEKDPKVGWELISYVYSKTGLDSQLGFETPKGYFGAAFAKYVMPYNDENGNKQGAAKYAVRFCGGGYIHGTPINSEEEVNREFFMKQKEFTLGTFSGTRKCIRTTEPHAKFIFDWVVRKPNKNANVQNLTENLVVIVF